MKIVYFLLFCCITNIFATAQTCNNLNFETGDFTGWQGAIGYNTNSYGAITVTSASISTMGVNAPDTSCSFHTIVTVGSDPYSGLPTVQPGGGIYACRLGGQSINIACDEYNPASIHYSGFANASSCTSNDPTSGTTSYSNGEDLQQTFTVTSSNCLFYYNYAVVMSNAPDAGNKNPYFAVRVYNQQNTPLPCLNFFLEPDTLSFNPPMGFSVSPTPDKTGNQVIYSGWNTNSINLSPYIGQVVTIKFTAAGCAGGSHFCYAYIDAGCGEAPQILTTTLCSNATNNLIAPPSIGGTYAWVGPGIVSGANAQMVYINASGTYSVTVTNQHGCSYTLDTTVIINPNPAVSFSLVQDATPHTWDSYPTYPANVSYVSWDWGDSTAPSTSLYPSHVYANPGKYNICLTLIDSNNCSSVYCLNDSLYKLSNSTQNTMVYVNVLNSTVGIGQFSAGKTQIKIYPNPAQNNFTVEVSGNQKQQLYMFDISGKQILQQTITATTTIDASTLSNGVYFIQLKSSEAVSTQKLIVQH